jgi:hypothetical protein
VTAVTSGQREYHRPFSRHQTEKIIRWAVSRTLVRMDTSLQLRRRPWIWPALLSLDAPVVAVLWQSLFSVTLGIRVTPSETAVLAMAVWLIYVADRILDSFRESEREPLAPRHRFYRDYRAAFVVPFCAILLLAAYIAWTRLDARTLRDGVALAAMVAAYFGVVHFSGNRVQQWFPKELAVAILFCAGSCLPVAARIPEFTVPDLAVFGAFVATAWMNTALIEYSEWITLREGGAEPPAALTVVVARGAVPLGITIGALAIAAMALPGFRTLRPVLLAEIASVLALAGLGASWRRLSSHVLRISADAVLCTPAIILAVLATIGR